MAINATILSMAKEAKGSSIAASNRICFDGGSGKNKFDNSTPKLVDRVCDSVRPICYGSRQRK